MTGDHGKGYSKHARIRSRRSAVQAYYQWIMTRKPPGEIIDEFRAERAELKKADIEYFAAILQGMVEYREQIDSELNSLLDRKDSELDPVENSVLHLGSYELMYVPDIPARVVINESVELARMFGAEDSHKYINGVLDRLARRFRPAEMRNTGSF